MVNKRKTDQDYVNQMADTMSVVPILGEVPGALLKHSYKPAKKVADAFVNETAYGRQKKKETGKAVKSILSGGSWSPSDFSWFQDGGNVNYTGPAFVHSGEYILPRGVKPTKKQRRAVRNRKMNKLKYI